MDIDMNSNVVYEMRPTSTNNYQIGIICALAAELAAVTAVLDGDYGEFETTDRHDDNVYRVGRIHGHYVVIACLPAGVDGTSAAATVAKDMLRTFTQIRFGILAGIGGGIPDLQRGIDIRLGDVVISQPDGIHGGVVQFDKFRYQGRNGRVRKGALNAPPTALLTALQLLQAEHELHDSRIPTYLAQMLQQQPQHAQQYAHPGRGKDILFASSEDISVEATPVTRIERASLSPHLHYGTIASGNQVVKDATLRDSLRKEYGAKCVEMEAAGLMNNFPCLVVRGIADYADRHKNSEWQRYAAATAAAFTKELLLYVSVSSVNRENSVKKKLETENCINSLPSIAQAEFDAYEGDHQPCHPKTRLEILHSIQEWVRQPHSQPIFWLSGMAGTGKSTISRTVAERLATSDDSSNVRLASFFFKRGERERGSAAGLFPTIAKQLAIKVPELGSLVAEAVQREPRNSYKNP